MGCQASHAITPTFRAKASLSGKKVRGDGKPQPLKQLRGRDIPFETVVQSTEGQSASDEWDLRSEDSRSSHDNVVCLGKVVPLPPDRQNDKDHLHNLNTFLTDCADHELWFRVRVGERRNKLEMMHNEYEEETDWNDMLSTEVPWQRNRSTASTSDWNDMLAAEVPWQRNHSAASKGHEATSSNASTSASDKSGHSSHCSPFDSEK